MPTPSCLQIVLVGLVVGAAPMAGAEALAVTASELENRLAGTSGVVRAEVPLELRGSELRTAPFEAVAHTEEALRLARELHRPVLEARARLAIAKSIVEMHHGRIWMEGTKGLGSRFRFSLHRRITPAET